MWPKYGQNSLNFSQPDLVPGDVGAAVLADAVLVVECRAEIEADVRDEIDVDGHVDEESNRPERHFELEAGSERNGHGDVEQQRHLDEVPGGGEVAVGVTDPA